MFTTKVVSSNFAKKDILNHASRLLFEARILQIHYFINELRHLGPRSLSNFLRDLRVNLLQDKLLKKNYNPRTKKLIMFVTPGFDIVCGGNLSISSVYEETMQLKHIHGAESILCTIHGEPVLLKYTQFENQNYIYRFSQVLSYFKNLQHLMIHVPEYCIGDFLKNVTYGNFIKLSKIESVQINIMLQNIELLPPLRYIAKLKEFGKLTCTTAHEKYSTRETRKQLGFPLHKLSVFVSPEQYERRAYAEKEDLMVVSPDPHADKWSIIKLIAKQFPKLRIQIISNLTYEEYKKLISKAKWALTFGEGLDNYFLETVFSGGISFSVYNSNFFTEDFKSLRTVYDNYDVLIKKICSDIRNLDNEKAYADYQEKQYALCSKHYNYKEYIKNLELFYKGEYTYK